MENELKREEGWRVDVVNDIACILRIQGQTFESAAIYEPAMHDSNMISISTQSFGNHLQFRGAAVLGRMLANSALQVVESDLGKRLQRDRWLVSVIAALTRNLNPKQNAREAAEQAVGFVPDDKPVHVSSLIRRAVADVTLTFTSKEGSTVSAG